MDRALLTGAAKAETAFETRKLHFADEISFFAPGIKRYATDDFEQKTPQAFLPISLTAGACALQCDHCVAKILDPMIPLDPKAGLFRLCEKLAANGTKGILVSGGSRKTGEVPFEKHLADLARVKQELGLRIMVHSGLVTEKIADGFKKAGVDGVALDIIGSDETIRDVYHLDATVNDFERSLELLAQYELSARPHIILGLHWGKLLGEFHALEMIARNPLHALILVILVPMANTPMAGIEPTPPEQIEPFFATARLRLPDTSIMIGCARPGGEHKLEVDRLAVDYGLNGIAYPAEGIIEYSRTRGLKPVFFEDSCSCGC